ncbi:hypothetical protein OESDEN_00496 [Oesophagostomum dentatum]|uniref:Uncharacterized protein n=1 Tax=Oesophagostomum dentatum TaxID=61180 RepID=A0A0B1TVP4_OESDE|nr:hypothetical protein OESDEN_00496 [Oesophagostomum dentatum]
MVKDPEDSGIPHSQAPDLLRKWQKLKMRLFLLRNDKPTKSINSSWAVMQIQAPRSLQSFLLANKEAILSLLQDMDRPEEERSRRQSASSHPDRPSGYSCSSPRSSQR